MKLYKKDIRNIGYTVFEEYEGVSFICSGLTANIEEILLREILVLFGCKILGIQDHGIDRETIDIKILTNLSFKELNDTDF